MADGAFLKIVAIVGPEEFGTTQAPHARRAKVVFDYEGGGRLGNSLATVKSSR